MKDTEFLELLNLYLDHEISATDAARLEAEVLNNEGRRAIYREYCQMQKACKILVADFQPERGGAAAMATDRKVGAPGAQAPWRAPRIGFYAAGLATLAAACVALIFARREIRQPEANAPQNLARSVAGKQAIGSAPTTGLLIQSAEHDAFPGLVAAVAAPGRSDHVKVTLVSEPLVLSGNRRTGIGITAEPPDDQLAWMRDFQLVSLQERKQLEQFRFEVAPATLRPDGRHLGGRPPAEPTVEMNAFRFVK